MKNETETTPIIHHGYRLEVEPTDQATIRVLARRWNMSEAETLTQLLALALNRWGDVRPGDETATYCAELERTAALLKRTNGITRRTRAIAA